MFEKFKKNYPHDCTLDGHNLNSGDLIIIKWPNGNVTKESVRIEISESSDYEKIINAFVVVNYNGAKARIYLNQDGIECERVESK